MDLFKKNLTVLLFLFIPMILCAQSSLIQDVLPIDYELNAKSVTYFKKYKAKAAHIQLVRVNTAVLHENEFFINTPKGKSLATQTEDRRRTERSFSWFGRLEDDSGIYCSVMEEQVFSKFSIKRTAYSLLPLEADIHMLIEVKTKPRLEDHVDCVHQVAEPKVAGHEHEHPVSSVNARRSDEDCRFRVAIMYTQDAANNIGENLALFSQGLVDEANLAYSSSAIALRAEVARTIIINHTESDAQVNHPDGYQISEDFVTFHDSGDGILDEIHTIRDNYQSDVQVLVRENEIIGTVNGNTVELLGVAWTADATDADDAFAVVNNEALTLERFAFTHEIGHLQGAFHDDDNATPAYARGFILNNIFTIMTSGSTPENAWHIGQFSNPDLFILGVLPTGIDGDNGHDNARRLNETADRTRNYQTTNDDAVIQSETIGNEAFSNHLGNHTITTGGNEVVYEQGSVGNIRAGQEVLLETRTLIKAGSKFRAFLGNCEEAVPLPFSPPEIDHEHQVSVQAIDSDLKFDSQNSIRNYPNPFSKATTFEIQLQEATTVQLELFNLSGQRVNTLIEHQLMSRGAHQFELQATQMQAGIYIYHFTTATTTQTGKIILTRE